MSAEQPPKHASQAPAHTSGEHARVSGSHSRYESGRVEAEEELDLTAEQRRRIDDVFSRLETMSHYDLLGVARTADKKTIKRAYFERTNEFHPDRFFRQRLGGYKSKMEAIFGRTSEAHDVLCSPERRVPYDATLRRRRASDIDDMIAQATREMRGAEEGSRHEEAMFDDAIRVDDSEPPPAPRHPSIVPSAAPPRLPSVDMQARRDALARRLTGQGPRPVTSRPPAKK